MRIKCLGIALLLAMQVHTASCQANEAQAALSEARTPYQYAVPGHLSSEEKGWFKVFQEGNLLIDGWQKISANILERTPTELRDSQKRALEDLGNKIGLEWCRPNNVRKVSSSMLQDWGGLLKKTARQNPLQLAQAIAYIDQEVDSVLD